MRTLVLAMSLLLTCGACGAPQPTPEAKEEARTQPVTPTPVAPGAAAPSASDAAPSRPPNAPASSAIPAASASAEARASWCERYVPSVVAEASVDLPPDVRPTHLMEVEFNSCTLDPQVYARQTGAGRGR
jgi:hypothetical protein